MDERRVRAARGFEAQVGRRPPCAATRPAVGPVPEAATCRAVPGEVRAAKARVLLGAADSLLAQAGVACAADPAESFRLAYLAALRGASALLALGEAPRRRTRSRSAWVLLATAVPSMAPWAEHFAALSSTRVLIEAGATCRVTVECAERLRSEAQRFLDLVEESTAAGMASPAGL